MPKLKNIFLHLLIMSFFVGFVLAIRFKPITQSLELDYDEGLNLIKAFLYGQGFFLYTQIWNDQAPFFTVILSQWFHLFGQSIFAARFLIILFSALLIWCFYQIINSELGKIPAFVATLILFTSGLFIRLSISVMIGIPSLSLAMLSIYFLHFYKKHYRQPFLIWSGGLLALSLQTKLFTVFLIPLMLCYLAFPNVTIFQKKQLKTILQPFLWWLGSLVVVFLLIGLWFQQFSHLDQIFESHFHQPIETKLGNFNNFEYLKRIISQDYEYVFLAFLGILTILIKKQRNGLFPLAWLVTATLILIKHKPIWDHHYLLLTIPISWLAAYAVASVRDFCKSWHFDSKSLKIKDFIFLILSVTFIFLMITTPANPKGRPSTNVEVIQLLLKHKNLTHWVFTDRPIYAFYAGLRVPPEMAVISYKRFNSGDLTSKELLAILQNYCPEQMVLGRWISQIKSDSDFMAYVNENYSKTYTDEKNTVEHYLLKEVDKFTPKQ
ncbi:MAG: glycosyltransferase family 39 protein [Hassallia sp. WJT32-NPBG1]|jgi:4-amino-4-deoxy-L-arabinose transferase-like glycosyltransferase|nr:glycosyltransferase family 39 protein [Hassallia sp. WJT32-NPBG1]